MRFDNIASAANTPGGFQAGVNDIIQAVMGAKRQEAQQAFQQSQMDQQQANSDRSFGAEQAQRLSSNEFREREIKNSEARTRQDGIQNGQKFIGGLMDRADSVGKSIGDMFSKPGGMTEYQKIQVKRQESEDAAKADAGFRQQARDMSGFSKEGLVHKKIKVPRMGAAGLDGSQSPLIVDGQPVWDEKVIDDMPTDRHWADLESNYQKLKDPAAWQAKEDAKNSQFRGEVMPQAPAPRAAGGTPGLGSQVAQTLATQNTGDTNGLSQNEPMAQAPAIDYAAEDAKLQATNPQYRQLRANPQFNWKGAVEKAAAMRAQQPR